MEHQDETNAIEALSDVSDRRNLLKRVGLITTAAVAGSVGAEALTAPAGAAAKGRVRAIDVACNIATLTVSQSISEAPVAPGFPPQGSTFYVEGAVFSGGTIPPGPGFDYDVNLHRSIGHWFCYGSFMHQQGRPSPFQLSTQTYVLGRIRRNRPFPRAQLMSHGLEGAEDPAESPVRAVIGGTGPYAGVSGTVRQIHTGLNTTVHPVGLQGPNLRFNFRYS